MCLTDTPHEPHPTSPPRAARRRTRRWWLALCALGAFLGLLLLALTVLDAVPARGSSSVRRADAEQPVPRGGYRWPLDGNPRVTRPFEPPPRPWAAGHRGVDLAGTPGAPVRAAAAGVVHFAGTVVDRGVVSIRHAAGLRTTYEPVAPLVTVGQVVRAGDIIGTLMSGHAGCPLAACLHWGLRRADEYLDPLAMLGAGRIRLLPNARPAAHRVSPPGRGRFARHHHQTLATIRHSEPSGTRMRLLVRLP